MKLKGMSINAFVCALVSPLIVAASETGTIQLVDEAGLSVLTYSSGEAIHVEVSDPDLNSNLSIVESVQVLVTSETENTGSQASHTLAIAGKNNVGDGSLRVMSTGYDTLTEDWTVTAVNSYSFIVTGSESGLQSQQYDIYANDNGYVTDNSEVRFKIDTGAVGFNTGDSFTFSTIAGTIVGEAVTLTETDVDSGVFTGSIDVNETATPLEGDGLLDIQTGDLITAVYTDAAGDWGDEEQVRTTALYAATVLPGATLLKDTVWTKENSPYLITGDITVSSDVTLTIMAGVEVLFLANSDDTSDGQNPYNSELWINGSLVVAGNDDDKVVFTSSNRNGEVGDWGGIRINNGSASIAHMLMEYSDYGIATQDMYDNAVFSITHSELTNNRQAISAFSLYNNGTAIVSNNHIHDNAGYALQASYGNAVWSINNNTIENNGSTIYLYDIKGLTLDGNTITGNQNRGVYLDSIEGDMVITDNVITDNQDGGIYGYSYSYGNNTSDYTATITGNTVSGNNGSGIELTLSKHNHIDVSNNEVDGNSGSGIRLYGESNATKASVHNNTITNNGQDGYYGSGVGLYISGNVVPSIVGNVIDGNGAGVYVSYAESSGNSNAEVSGNQITNNDDYGISVHNYANPAINGNDIYGNGGYALANHTSNAINAKNNWWGEDDTAEMNEGDNPKALSFIYDGSENSATGGVNYSGWLNGSITTGGEPTSQTSTGELYLVDSEGNVAQTYESGATVYLNLADIDGNISTSDVDTITVLVTSETEDTGEKASHTLAIAGKNNVGDGSLRVMSTGYDTLTEDWTVTAVNSYSFIVTGSESG
ncbi:right-handed parallel beta-helix repeat-containing protein, partial [Alteromonas sp. BMJM2]|uniref:right-handed parallel beta-helix repeat-containing protein n=1 Tax=Alteromonas sp. BMJM2 TaxID=2954241 RepID=UPI0022B5A8A2